MSGPKVPGFLVTAPSSSSGKTIVTLVLLEILRRKGLHPAVFKTGPDYIDPMYHSAIAGGMCHNLDSCLCSPDMVRRIYNRYAAGHDLALVEGAMGYYDGVGGVSEQASAYEIGRILDLPAVLVLPAPATALTGAAIVRGIAALRESGPKERRPKMRRSKELRPEECKSEELRPEERADDMGRMPEKNSGIQALILNRCSQDLFERTAPVIEREAKIPVLGYMPKMPEAVLPSRHLGLVLADEIRDLKERVRTLADEAEKTIDTDRLLSLLVPLTRNARAAEDAEKLSLLPVPDLNQNTNGLEHADTPVIAVARDEAFCFLYEECVDLLRDLGAEVRYFSPVHDREIPEDASALYLPGGYPELYADKLSANKTMLASIRKAALGGLPLIAECGGYMYLCRSIETGALAGGSSVTGRAGGTSSGGSSVTDRSGGTWPGGGSVTGRAGGTWPGGSSVADRSGKTSACEYPMAGIFPGNLKKTPGLVRFGYASMMASEDSLLFRKGETVRIHSFHHFDTEEDDRGSAFSFQKEGRHVIWQEGYAGKSFYAAFPHLYLPGCPEAAERFVEAARCFAGNYR